MTQEHKTTLREEIISQSLCTFSSSLLFSATCCQISFLSLAFSKGFSYTQTTSHLLEINSMHLSTQSNHGKSITATIRLRNEQREQGKDFRLYSVILMHRQRCRISIITDTSLKKGVREKVT